MGERGVRKWAAWFLIPRGYYCHGKRMSDVCPFWFMDRARPEQDNGYCSFMGKGDWEINDEPRWTCEERTKDGAYVTDGQLHTGHEVGLPMSLLWDQCKECGVKL
jgi:hypothetical protein